MSLSTEPRVRVHVCECTHPKVGTGKPFTSTSARLHAGPGLRLDSNRFDSRIQRAAHPPALTSSSSSTHRGDPQTGSLSWLVTSCLLTGATHAAFQPECEAAPALRLVQGGHCASGTEPTQTLAPSVPLPSTSSLTT